MNIYDGRLNTITALIGTYFTWLFGTWEEVLAILLTLMLIDYLFGVIKGFVLKKLSSNVGFKGIAKKSGILVIVAVAALLDRLINNGDWIFKTLVCYFYIANEALSITENCAAIGLPIPNKIKEALEQLGKENK
ncbi:MULTISPECIES: phage holin family protein [unclassified Clostridioides]|uniref:phage holin family protein n=1 Tax=unclassified Clostridioides TaxID=2635829 RepID=UPI001D1299DF|nr:phage holin family protein [Clostridioides sp. ZZV14-6150]MCC0659079.1 phage holin family protein [Clostridioides sp. ZZV14-6154]MCC0693863.1 phage holin family protein [Clostridioides sp. ZZV14-6387]MCC0722365.1 phage holin family protein [Clostridioides sp. ZZV14-6104]MCC0744412.1 phage holin family protein [Clostridioides sp. ZZV14-6044]MCC0752460.1 phage holin family protein [Clostridioides sp. ZZV13-5731]